MSRGPLRRLTGAAGLLALAPTGYLLAAGSVAAGDAALRAAGTLVGVLLLGRLADRGLTGILRTYERAAVEEQQVEERRRAEDAAATGADEHLVDADA